MIYACIHSYLCTDCMVQGPHIFRTLCITSPGLHAHKNHPHCMTLSFYLQGYCYMFFDMWSPPDSLKFDVPNEFSHAEAL